MENRLSDYNCFSLRTAIYICCPLRTANVVSLYSKRSDNISARTEFLLNYGLQGINAILLKGNFVKERNYYEDFVDYYKWW